MRGNEGGSLYGNSLGMVLTGLLDITLNLLFAMTVLVVISQGHGSGAAAVSLPAMRAADGAQAAAEGRITEIAVNADGRILVGGTPVRLDEIAGHVGPGGVCLSIDEKAPAGIVVRLEAALNGLGKKELGLRVRAP